MIEGAEASLSGAATLGESSLYACSTGYHNAGGHTRLYCKLSDDYVSTWTGSHVECTKGNQHLLYTIIIKHDIEKGNSTRSPKNCLIGNWDKPPGLCSYPYIT